MKRLWVSALCLCLIFAGCGGGDDDNSVEYALYASARQKIDSTTSYSAAVDAALTLGAETHATHTEMQVIYHTSDDVELSWTHGEVEEDGSVTGESSCYFRGGALYQQTGQRRYRLESDAATILGQRGAQPPRIAEEEIVSSHSSGGSGDGVLSFRLAPEEDWEGYVAFQEMVFLHHSASPEIDSVEYTVDIDDDNYITGYTLVITGVCGDDALRYELVTHLDGHDMISQITPPADLDGYLAL